MSTPPNPSDLSTIRENLERDLREWWEERNDWGSEDGLIEDGGVWSSMPEIDSKEVTRAAPICENHLDIEFDPALIREGGYDSIDDLINDLVPKLIEAVEESE